MFKRFKNTNRQTEFLNSAVETWMVEWENRISDWDIRPRKAYQGFTDEEEAKKFKESLEQAFKLIGYKIENKVMMYKANNGL